LVCSGRGFNSPRLHHIIRGFWRFRFITGQLRDTVSPMRRKNTQGKEDKEEPITFKSKSVKIYRTVNRLYQTNRKTGEKELKSKHPQFTLLPSTAMRSTKRSSNRRRILRSIRRKRGVDMPAQETLLYLESQLTTQISGFDSSRQYFRKQQLKFTVTVMNVMK